MELGHRIRSSRAAGIRLILPGAEEIAVPRVRAGYWATAAAAVALFLGWLAVSERPGHEPPEVVTGSPLWPAMAFAQESIKSAPPPRYAPFTRADPSRLHPGHWVYDVHTLVDGMVPSDQGRRILTVQRSEFRGRPAVAIVNRWENRYAALTDSLVVEPSTLAPRYRAMWTGNGRRTWFGSPLDFSDDSTAGFLLFSYPPHQPEQIGFVSGFSGHRSQDLWPLKTLFQLTPLDHRATGSVYALIGRNRATGVYWLYPIDFRVVGEGHVTVPAGTFDCWQVLVTGQGTTITFWVSKAEQDVVKTASRLYTDSEELVVEHVLLSHRPAGGP